MSWRLVDNCEWNMFWLKYIFSLLDFVGPIWPTGTGPQPAAALLLRPSCGPPCTPHSRPYDDNLCVRLPTLSLSIHIYIYMSISCFQYIYICVHDMIFFLLGTYIYRTCYVYMYMIYCRMMNPSTVRFLQTPQQTPPTKQTPKLRESGLVSKPWCISLPNLYNIIKL